MNKKKYSVPTIKFYLIEVEESISSASARIDPLGLNNDIIETWIEDEDETKSFTW